MSRKRIPPKPKAHPSLFSHVQSCISLAGRPCGSAKLKQFKGMTRLHRRFTLLIALSWSRYNTPHKAQRKAFGLQTLRRVWKQTVGWRPEASEAGKRGFLHADSRSGSFRNLHNTDYITIYIYIHIYIYGRPPPPPPLTDHALSSES